tara:strand:- start:1658 stop:2635 length:978 start_codon:yes stop_codon:yes gene_type:complete
MNKNTLVALLFFSTLVLIFGIFDQEDKYLQKKGNIFGTTFSITVKNIEDEKFEIIFKEVMSILNNIDNTASNYKVNSEVSKFNRLDVNRIHKMSEDFSRLIFLSDKVYSLTDGYFDVTINNVFSNYKFYGDKNKITPVNNTFQDLSFDFKKNIIFKKNKKLTISLSGIAKGYAVDKLSEYLKQEGLESFLINIGGDLSAYGNTPWLIEIENPVIPHKYESVNIKNMSIASSGTYKNIVKGENKNYSHIIDPKSNVPIIDGSKLVSVIEENCAEADAIATGLLAMNIKDIIKFSDENNIASMLIYKADNNFVKKYSKNFKKYLISE